jgi:hypothetical protein
MKTVLVNSFNKFFSSQKKEYLRQKRKGLNDRIQFYNWWGEPIKDSWLYKFTENSGLLTNSQKQISFCSVFGSRKVLYFVATDAKVFFSGENLHNPGYSEYADALLGDNECDLSLGFDCFEDDRYMRFPLWLMYMFSPSIDVGQIKQRCMQLRYPQQQNERKRFASLIARYDTSGLRTEIYNVLSQIGRVDCPSQVLHNDESLHIDYKDNKTEYLKRYKFNVCPENSNSYGYVTEKVFEAIASGCVPVYWGSYNMPEPGILNPDAIVFWDKQDGGSSAAKTVGELYSDENNYRDFASQPRLLDTAEGKVEEMIIGLYDRLKEIINNI